MVTERPRSAIFAFYLPNFCFKFSNDAKVANISKSSKLVTVNLLPAKYGNGRSKHSKRAIIPNFPNRS